MKPHFRPANADDVYKLHPRIREVDVDEVKATIGLDIFENLGPRIWCTGRDSNPRPPDSKSGALSS